MPQGISFSNNIIADFRRDARVIDSVPRKSILGFMAVQLPDPRVYRQPAPCGKKAGLRTEYFRRNKYPVLILC